MWRTVTGTGCWPCLLITDDLLSSCQGADPLSDLAPLPTSDPKPFNSESIPVSIDHVEAVILGEVCVGEVREGRVSYFSFPHRTRPTHDLSWGLTIRIRRILGPFESVRASAVYDGLPLADIKVFTDYIKDLLCGR